ncbi:MAG: hypothetical protein ABIJ92_03225 [Candidatus Aenigmatarchaeota archaeon]
MKLKKLTDYRNFWLIWLTCAEFVDGVSLFRIQKEWGIKSNHLYHKESGLRKPLFKEMIESGYLAKEKNKLIAKFDWVAEYMVTQHKDINSEGWSPNLFVIESWPKIHTFMEKNQSLFFKLSNIKILYKNSTQTMRKVGFSIFNDIFLVMLILNIVPFCKNSNADIVIRIMDTITAFSLERDLYHYAKSIIPHIYKAPDLPKLIKDERELVKVLSPLPKIYYK